MFTKFGQYDPKKTTIKLRLAWKLLMKSSFHEHVTFIKRYNFFAAVIMAGTFKQ